MCCPWQFKREFHLVPGYPHAMLTGLCSFVVLFLQLLNPSLISCLCFLQIWAHWCSMNTSFLVLKMNKKICLKACKDRIESFFLKDNFETGRFISISICNQHLLSFCCYTIKVILSSNWEAPQWKCVTKLCSISTKSLTATEKKQPKTKQNKTNTFERLTEPQCFQKAFGEFPQQSYCKAGKTHLENIFHWEALKTTWVFNHYFCF